MQFSLRVVFVVVALLTLRTEAQGQQCDFPTEKDVRRIAAEYYQAEYDARFGEGTPIHILAILQVHFTCMARVALDKYSWTTVVVKLTTNFLNFGIPGIYEVRQFQMKCNSSQWGRDPRGNFDYELPPMPFDIETQYQCADCLLADPNTDNYDADSNCLHCVPECLSTGGGFCTGETAADCCPFFNNDTGACVDDCTTTDDDLGPNNDFVCVCSICEPGQTLNNDCSCELTDGCEAAGQPCQNGGTCTSNLSAPPHYFCQCPANRTGQNCENPIIPCHDGCPDPPTMQTTNAQHPAMQPTNVSSCLDCEVDHPEDPCHDGCPDPPTMQTTNAQHPAMQPTNFSSCLDCEVDHPEEEVGQSPSTHLVVGIVIGLVLFIFLILALAALLVYVIYMWTNKQKLKKRATTFLNSNRVPHSNPPYLTPPAKTENIYVQWGATEQPAIPNSPKWGATEQPAIHKTEEKSNSQWVDTCV